MTSREIDSQRRRNNSIAAKREMLTENLKRSQAERDAKIAANNAFASKALADRLIAEFVKNGGKLPQ